MSDLFKKFEHPINIGLSFGLASGVITTLGLLVGLNAGTHSKLVVLGGILTIAIADAFSDALGIHMSEESENKHTESEIWVATFMTFLFKFIFASTFLIPILLLNLDEAVIVSIAWGLFLLLVYSYRLAKRAKISTWGVIREHLLIAVLVIIITNSVGNWIAANFS
ncbi:hypothetical protein H0O02_01595 [Candidatus Micrarchaeota archaeon]|nr:hypothetical protein [Candidatus Micrarchaeota archaeon]